MRVLVHDACLDVPDLRPAGEAVGHEVAQSVGLLRLSVALEEVDDLWHGLEAALAAASVGRAYALSR